MRVANVLPATGPKNFAVSTVGVTIARVTPKTEAPGYEACQGVTIYSDKANVGDVFVGDSTTTLLTGFPISPGGSLTYAGCSHPSLIYAISAAGGQTLRIQGL